MITMKQINASVAEEREAFFSCWMKEQAKPISV